MTGRQPPARIGRVDHPHVRDLVTRYVDDPHQPASADADRQPRLRANQQLPAPGAHHSHLLTPVCYACRASQRSHMVRAGLMGARHRQRSTV
jgi:hypothetical protein